MIYLIQLLFTILILIPCQAVSQSPLPSASDYQCPSSYNPLGSGARAVGMGGAFIGVADDATAASWNPAGLVQLERSEVSVVGTFLHRNEDLLMNPSDSFTENQSINENDINYFSLSHCFTFLQRNMVFSLNYQNLYDFNRQWQMAIPFESHISDLDVDIDVDFISDGNLYAIGLAYAIEVLPRLSLGFTLNFWDDAFSPNSWETRTNTNFIFKRETVINDKSSIKYTREDQINSKYGYELENGLNVNLGFLWEITPRLSLGGVFKSRFTMDLIQKSYTINRKKEHTVTIMNSNKTENIIEETTPETDNLQYELTMPVSYGLGLAWKITNLWTVSLDIYRTEWDEFLIKTDQGEFSPLLSAAPLNNDYTNVTLEGIPTIKPTHQIRLGTEYLVVNKAKKTTIPFRMGFFYDPVPGKESPDKSMGFSLGTGFSKSPYNFDIAFQYRRAKNLGEDFQLNSIQSFDMTEAILYTSFIYHF